MIYSDTKETMPTLSDVRDRYADSLEATNAVICGQINTHSKQAASLLESVHLSRGKQLRPLFVYAFSEAFGGQSSAAIHLAAAVEAVHVASLVHDDVIDQCDTRRHRPTMNKLFSNSEAVLLGDLVFTSIFRHLTKLKNVSIISDFTEVIDVLINGELLQQENCRNFDVDFLTYREVLANKTGALLELCASSSARISGVSTEVEKLAAEFGREFGVVFQMVDDWADFCFSGKDDNKDRGIDIANGFITLPWLLLLKYANSESRQNLIGVMEAGEASGFGDAFIRDLALETNLMQNVDRVMMAEFARVDLLVNQLSAHIEVSELCAFTDYLRMAYKKVVAAL